MTAKELIMIPGVSTIITAILFALFNFINGKRKKVFKDNEDERLALQALLRHNLRVDYKTYLAQGWIDMADKEDYHNMYLRYHNLGKNGVMDKAHEEIMNLPSTPEN